MRITEDTHPIEVKWIIKNVFWVVIFVFVLWFMGAFKREEFRISILIPLLIILPTVWFLWLVLMINNFHYNFGDKLITLKQGIIAKSERHIMYGRIQSIFISQSFIDKILGLATIIIENASDSGGALSRREAESKKNYWSMGLMGFESNAIVIPGLLYKNALEIKDFLMYQIKINPIDDAQSGL